MVFLEGGVYMPPEVRGAAEAVQEDDGVTLPEFVISDANIIRRKIMAKCGEKFRLWIFESGDAAEYQQGEKAKEK
jgi:hypothetical protein